VLIFDKCIGLLTGKTLLPYYHGVTDLFLSIFLVPPDLVAGASPIIPPAWTLSHEFLFYLLFGLAIRFRRVVLPILIIWIALIFLNFTNLFSSTNYIVTGFIFSSLNLEFIFGCIIAHFIIYHSYSLLRWRTIILVVGVATVVASWVASMNGFSEDPIARVATFGLSFAILILGIVLVETRSSCFSANSKFVTVLKQVGDASYSIYLLHFVPLFFLSIILRKISPTDGVYQWLMLYISCIVIIFLGWLAYYFIERPLLKWIKQYFIKCEASPI
jgi:peptidoglycan/LPS O-acetylase OafA/YrhL